MQRRLIKILECWVFGPSKRCNLECMSRNRGLWSSHRKSWIDHLCILSSQISLSLYPSHLLLLSSSLILFLFFDWWQNTWRWCMPGSDLRLAFTPTVRKRGGSTIILLPTPTPTPTPAHHRCTTLLRRPTPPSIFLIPLTISFSIRFCKYCTSKNKNKNKKWLLRSSLGVKSSVVKN